MPTAKQSAAMLRVHTMSLQIILVAEELLPSVPELLLAAVVLN